MTNNHTAAGTPHRRRMAGYRPLAQRAPHRGANAASENLKEPAGGGPAASLASGTVLPTNAMGVPSSPSASRPPAQPSVHEVEGAPPTLAVHPGPASAPKKQRMAGYRPMLLSRQEATTATALSSPKAPTSIQAPVPDVPVAVAPKAAARQEMHVTPSARGKKQRMAGYRPFALSTAQANSAASGHHQATPPVVTAAPAPTTPSVQVQAPQAAPAPDSKKQRMVGYRPMAPHERSSASASASRVRASSPAEGHELRMAETPKPVLDQPSGQPMPAADSPATAQVPQQRLYAEPTPPSTHVPSGTGSTDAVTKTPPKSRQGLPTQAPPTRVAIPGIPVSSPAKTPASPLASATGTSGKQHLAWVKPVTATAAILVLAVVVVLCARWLRTLEPVQEFIVTYNGHASQPEGAPTGLPRWLGWQHFLNMFFMVLIVRTGLQVRNERKPPGYWTAKENSFFSPRGNTPKKVSLTQWLHQSLDVFWVLNGLVFIILLFATGQWMRIVPTSWDIFPNIVSTGIQYASLDWPTENGWIHYNALQVIAYFVTVFIAAPLAIISGVRFSTWWPEKARLLSKAYPVEWARAVHVPVMIYFIGFTLVHVFLVFFTGALRNLNHMYGSRDVVDWWGLAIFMASVLLITGAWFLARPIFTTPVAARMGKVSK